MVIGLISKYKRLIVFSIFAIIWLYSFSSFFTEDFGGSGEFDSFKDSILGPKLLIVAVILAVVVVFAGNVKMAKTTKVLNYLSEYRLPPELKATLIEKVDDSTALSGNLIDLLDNISVDQKFYYSIGTSGYKERSFSLYSASDNFSGGRAFATSTYYIARLNSLFLSGRKQSSHYSITKLYNGYLETFFQTTN
jgi:hypothetical protein